MFASAEPIKSTPSVVNDTAKLGNVSPLSCVKALDLSSE